MIYPYLTLSDETEVVHSGIEMKDGKETVRVYFEKPVETGFLQPNVLCHKEHDQK